MLDEKEEVKLAQRITLGLTTSEDPKPVPLSVLETAMNLVVEQLKVGLQPKLGIACFQRIIDYAEDNPAAQSMLHAYIGVLLQNKEEDLEGAERSFNTAIELNPRDLPARLCRAEFLLMQNRRDEGLRDIEEIMRLDPECNTASGKRAAAILRAHKGQ